MTYHWAKEKLSHKWHKVTFWDGKLAVSAKCEKMAKTWTYSRETLTEADGPACQTCLTL